MPAHDEGPVGAGTIGLVIPFYNGSAYFAEAIASAIGQTRRFDQIIVVDDGSAPAEQDFVAARAAQLGFTLLRQDNQGQGGARNRGVRELAADWVCFLDQDDILFPEHNAILLQAALALPEPRGWAFADFNYVDLEGRPLPWKGFPHPDMPVPPDLEGYLGRDLHMLPSASIYARDALLSVDGYDVQFRGYEDDDLHLRLHMAGFTCRFVPAPVYSWRQHSAQTSAGSAFIDSLARFVAKWAAFDFPAAVNRKRIRRALYERWWRIVRRLCRPSHRVRQRRALRAQIWTVRRIFPEFVGRRELLRLLTLVWLPPGPLRTRILEAVAPSSPKGRKRKGRHRAAL